MPTLSVIIPNHNHGHYLPEVVASCIGNGNAAEEVLVVDDASTDTSRAILLELAKRHRQLRVLWHNSRLGPAAALNTGVEAACSDWVLLRSADDICTRGSIARFRAHADRFPGTAMITGDLAYFAADPNRGVCERLGRATEPVEVDHASFLNRYGANIIHGASTFIRTAKILEIGGLDTALQWHCDWYMLLAIGLQHGFVYVPEVLGAMRLNGRSFNSQGTESVNHQQQVLEYLIEKLENEPLLLKRILACGCLDFFGELLLQLLRDAPSERQRRFAPLLAGSPKSVCAARRDTGIAIVIRGFLNRHVELIHRHAGSVAIYGAGGHTRQLLKIWREHQLPPPVLIIDNTEKPAGEAIDGIPVRRPIEVLRLNRPLVVLSSKSYEPLFVESMDCVLHGVSYLRIWGADDK